MSDGNSDNSERISIGRIPLKQVRVKKTATTHANPMNRLVPYLDLFCRLEDDELARLGGCDEDVAATLRKQVVAIDRALSRYVDLLPRLSDDELVRLTGATPKTIRFWRLCQPRVLELEEPDTIIDDAVVARAAKAKAVTAPQAAAQRIDPTESQRVAAVPAEDYSAEETGKYPTPSHAQASARALLQFSGEPFPGFEEESAPTPAEHAWTPAPEEVEIEALTDDLLDEPPPF
jgi:hypothetical protein